MRDCRAEMLLRIRKGLASDQERTAFKAHLGSCESCRMTLEVMDDFDPVGEAEPGDWERVGRMAAKAADLQGSTSPRGPVRVARGTWLLAVAALVLTGAAIAGGAVQLALRPAPQPQSSAKEATSPPLSTSRAPASKPEAEVSDEISPDTTQQKEPVAAPSGEVVATARPQTTAADVYRAANDARRTGQSHQAILGYQRLQRDYPGSAEAHASRVSLGGLLLRNGSSGAALAQFDAYLVAGGGRLAAEALFGRARALRALGRSADEARNLERLVENYPNSAYATHAQRRLRQLR